LPSNKFRKLTAPLLRKHSAVLFQLRSQHAPLAKHLHRLNKLPSPTCPCCGVADETVDHFLHFCPAQCPPSRSDEIARRRSTSPVHEASPQNTQAPPCIVYIHPRVWQVPRRIRRFQKGRAARQCSVDLPLFIPFSSPHDPHVLIYSPPVEIFLSILPRIFPLRPRLARCGKVSSKYDKLLPGRSPT
ncbi:hypothetical protein B0H17DRAFT_1224699, partial [Mycena rosella]